MLSFRVLILISGFTLLLSAENHAQSPREKLISLATHFTGDGGIILQRVGDYKFEKYLNRKDSAGILEDFVTVVHESCHQLNHLISMNERDPYRHDQGYFITKGVEITAEIGPVFNSTELNRIVPRKLQDEIFRYKTYVGTPQANLGSQVNGVYGLVEEFCAYYHGTKACYELYDFYYKYRCRGYKNTGEWANYVQNTASSYFAWYEFRLFISWYLEYAKKYHRDVYDSCMKNTSLRQAFTLIDDRFGQLVADFNTRIEDLAVKLSKGPVKAEIADYEGDKSFLIHTRESSTRTSTEIYSIFSNRIKLLQGLLEGERNAILASFRI